MKKFTNRCLAILLSTILIFTLNISVFGLEWNGSAGPVNAGGEGTSGGYRVLPNAAGYRFSVIDYEGSLVKSSVDILNGYNDDRASSAYRFNVKMNKTQLKNAYNSGSFSTSATNAGVCHDGDLRTNLGLSFDVDLPTNPQEIISTVSDWNVRDAVCRTVGLSGASALDTNAGYKLVVEPLYLAVIDGSHYHCCTPTEIAVFGRSRFGGSSNGGASSNSNSWGYISNYTNRYWPGSLYLSANETFISAGSNLSNRITFDTIITQGYGVAFAYNNTNPPTISVNPSVSIQLQQKVNGSFTDIANSTLLEEGQAYRGKYNIDSTGGTSVINFYDYNGFTNSRTYDAYSVSIPETGTTLYSNEFTITNNSVVSDNYDYNSATFNIAASVVFDASATATANGVTTATESNINDNSGSITCRYVTYKPTPENHLNNTTNIPDSMKATIENSVNNKNLYSGQIVEAYATYTNNSSFNNKLKYSWNFNFPTYYYTNDATYQAYNNGTESAYLAPGGSVSSDTTEQRVYNGSNDLNNTRQVTLTSSAGELTYINGASSNNRINTDTDTYNVYPTDLVASNVYFTDVENGNMLETVKAGQRVIAHYIFTNETKIPVWCTITVGHDNGAGYEHTETLVIAGNNGTASISSSPFTVDYMGENKICAYASIYLGDMNGDTSHENDGTNNVIRNSLIGEMGVIQIETPFVVEKIENNAEYKRGITVVSSYKVKNNAERDFGT